MNLTLNSLPEVAFAHESLFSDKKKCKASLTDELLKQWSIFKIHYMSDWSILMQTIRPCDLDNLHITNKKLGINNN